MDLVVTLTYRLYKNIHKACMYCRLCFQSIYLCAYACVNFISWILAHSVSLLEQFCIFRLLHVFVL